MEVALFALVREHRSLEWNIGSLTRFKASLKHLNTTILASDTDAMCYMLDVHYEALTNVKKYIKSNLMGDATIKQLYDQIFVKNLGLPYGKTGAPVTRLFEEFIKGITYFKHQIDPGNPSPIYHRFDSCGVGNQIYRDKNLICSKTTAFAENRRRRELIDRCYVERLIYDAIWEQDTLHFPQGSLSTTTGAHAQNQGHQYRIHVTKADYETCFPGITVDVNVAYDGRFPIYVKVIREKKGNWIYTEEYHQELKSLDRIFAPYTGIVKGTRTLSNGKMYVKVNDFLQEGNWRLVRS